MERLFKFLYYYRASFTFLLLEFFCAWLIVANNQYQSTKYFNSSNRVVAWLNTSAQNIREYFLLADINATLSRNNAMLLNKIEEQSQRLYRMQLHQRPDSSVEKNFQYIQARVINNSTKFYKNFITIDQGQADGISVGMAVTNSFGAVGKVKSVSKHYAVLISLLNIDNQVSSVLKRTGQFGTIQWDGTDPSYIDLKYIPRHVIPLVGDSVVTSGYNAVFPPGIFIGKIKEFKLRDEALFYDIKIELGQDFGRLNFVEVINAKRKAEKDSLELITIGEPR
ncbi:MAG: rod shape-determining protein MreC [Bacteroidetes bacterium]|nr:rod shape-determining protein MreC [Bacteroidota bacterium]